MQTFIEGSVDKSPYISLYGNKIGDEGCKHLSQALWANIQTLQIGHNIIGDVGCRHLSQAQWSNLYRLQLVQNKISKSGQAYVKNICQQVYFHQREH